ncbi:MAG: hypothetical protein ACT4P7_19500 [Gemmatimonadaceae bacterium]
MRGLLGRLLAAGFCTMIVATSLGAQRSRMRVALPGFGAQIVMDTVGEMIDVDAPPSKVFRAATLVFRNLKIPVDVSDSTAGFLGAAKLTRTRNLAGSALSRYLECGSGMTGPRADSHRVMMPLLVFIDPAPNERSRMRIAMVASAQDNSGTSNSPVQCGSTGALEGQLRKAIGDQVRQLP